MPQQQCSPAQQAGTTPHSSDGTGWASPSRITRPQWMAPKKLAMVAPYPNNAILASGKLPVGASQSAVAKLTNGISPP